MYPASGNQASEDVLALTQNSWSRGADFPDDFGAYRITVPAAVRCRKSKMLRPKKACRRYKINACQLYDDSSRRRAGFRAA